MQQLLSSIRGSVTTGNLSASSSSRPVPNASASIIASSTSSSLHSSPTIQPVSAPASSSSSVSPQAVAASPKRRPAPSLPLPPPLSLASPSAPVAAPTSDSSARDYHIPSEDKKRIQRIVREVITKFYKAKQLEKQQCLELEPQIIKRMYRRVHKEHARMRTSSSANGSGGSESATTPVDPELAERKKIRHWKEVVQFYVDQKWRELSAVAPASGATTTTTPASA